MWRHLSRSLLALLIIFTGFVSRQPQPVYAVSQTFTSSGSWQAPTGVTSVTVEVWGGGGAGGGATGNPATGGGGAGGAYARKVLSVTPGNSYSYTVGATKTATTTSTQATNTGNFSWFSSAATVYAPGGQGGAPSASNNGNGAAGAGSSTGAIGDQVYAGGNGSQGVVTSGSGYSGSGGGGAGSTGAGGNATTSTGGSGTTQNGGNGANGVGNNSAGATGSTYGGGGSGGKANNNTDRAGGSGAAGAVRITYNSAPSFSVTPTDSPDPVTVGDSVTFSATATDEENNWKLIVCKTNSVTAGSTPTCAADQSICVSSSSVASGSPNTCSWTPSGAGSQSWYAFACDDTSTNPMCSSVSTTNSPVQVNEAAVISISVTTDGTVAYGTVAPSATKSTIELSDSQTVKNDGNVAEDFNIKTSTATGGTTWTLGSAAASNVFVHEFSTNSGSDWTKFTTADSYQTLLSNIAANGTNSLDLRITVPSSTSDYQQKTLTVTIQAVQH